MKSENSCDTPHNQFFSCILISESIFETTLWLKMSFRSIPPPKTVFGAPAGLYTVLGGGIDLKFFFSQSVFSNVDSNINLHEMNWLWHDFGKSPIYSPLLLLVLIAVGYNTHEKWKFVWHHPQPVLFVYFDIRINVWKDTLAENQF